MSNATISAKATTELQEWTQADEKAWENAANFKDAAGVEHRFIQHDPANAKAGHFMYVYGSHAGAEFMHNFEVVKIKATPQVSKLLNIIQAHTDKVLVRLRGGDGTLYRGADIKFAFNVTEGTPFYTNMRDAAFNSPVYIPMGKNNPNALDLGKVIALCKFAAKSQA